MVKKTKAHLGLVPFSRFVEALLVRENTMCEKRKAEQNTRTEIHTQVPAAPASPSKPAAPPVQSKVQEQPRKWYDGMIPARKGGKP